MRNLILIAVMLMVCAVPAYAINIEMLDELTLGAKVQSQDIVLKSKHIDIGAEIGAFDLSNGTTAKNSFYAMGVITIKKISIFDLTK